MSQDPNDPNQPVVTTGGQTTSCSPTNQPSNGQQTFSWVTVIPKFPIQRNLNIINLDGIKKLVKKVNDKDGCDCKKCGEYNEYAESNQSDGSFICCKCRMGW